MVLELSVGHSGCAAIDDAEVGCGDVFCGGVAIGRRRVEYEASTCGMPFFCLVLFLCVLFFGVVKLLALDFVLVLGLLGGAGDARGKGPAEVGCVCH